jgi:cytochrome c oxidase cbb3-type subunit 3
MGPPLMDDQWIYGNRPANLYDVIVEGRPAGMPAFGAKIPDDQIWKIIAFIESMGGMQYRDEVVAAGDASEQNQTQSQD